MKRKTLFFLMLFVIVFVVAEVPKLRFPEGGKGSDSTSIIPSRDSLTVGSTANQRGNFRDSTIRFDQESRPLDSMMTDTATMDSLQKAIWMHNKLIDDSLRADSINRQRKNGIDAPVEYTAGDSMVYEGATKRAYLYGNSHVKYENMDLESDQISMSMDSSLVHAMGSVDSTGAKFGTPVFKMGSDTYETDTMSFNFKTKKGLISDVYTQQDEGYMTSQLSKRGANGDMFLYHGRYTTCDQPHPDFYFAMSRAKVRPGKDVVFGPTYLVVADVPLPFAIPYGFFPFTKSYSSGFIMPTYGDESTRGFYLRDGGYYFAVSDKMDLKLLGEIYTKGSWGVSAASNYRKRYKYSGQFFGSYQSSVTGDKNMPDYLKSTSFKVQWTHRQDAKANPYRSLTASVNFATTDYERNNLASMYDPQAMTQSTRTSSVNLGTKFSSLNMDINSTFSLNQNMRDSTIALTLPTLSINVSRFYPFKRKKAAGKERWYEKISMSYTGNLENSINAKEDKVLKSSLTKDWRNGISHKIPIDASFTLLNYLNLTPRISINDRMYSQKQRKSWDEDAQKERIDTLQGFYNVYDWDVSLSANTTLYGFYVPNRKLFGEKIQAIRHVFKPSLTFQYKPDFSASHYGFWDTYQKTDADGNVTLVEYNPYAGQLFGGGVSQGKTGSVGLSVSNNVEMKVKTEDGDSVGYKKISLIDDLSASMSYNMAAKERPWSDLSTSLRIKLSKRYTLNISTSFATYAYEADSVGAQPYIGTRTEYSKGRFGRFQGTSQNLNYTLDNEKVSNFFKWLRGEKTSKKKDDKKAQDDEEDDPGVESNIDTKMEAGKHGAKKENAGMAETDENGYMAFQLPFSLTFGYGISVRENTSGTFNYDTMRYPYKVTQNLNISGNIRLSDGWNISFTSGYDFENKKISMTTASLGRDLHCFNMSCNVVLAPHTSYNFSFRCNAATLTDALKYDKRSNASNAVQWY